MNIVLDTHAFLWWLFDAKDLSRKARAAIADPDNDVFVSSVSAFEISAKYRLGKLNAARPLVGDIAGWIARAGFLQKQLDVRAAEAAGLLEWAHRDPFDRLLVAQALTENLTLVSNERHFDETNVKRLW